MKRSTKVFAFALAAVALSGTASTARAQGQDPEALRKLLMIDVSKMGGGGGGLSDLFRGAPGTNTGTPLAFGPAMGDFFVGGGYQASTRGTKLANGSLSANGNDDGSVSAGFGLGDGNDVVGLETVITSLSTFRSGFGNRTAFSFQAYHNIDNTWAVAVGVENAFISGGGKTDGTDSWYGVTSKVFQKPWAGVDWVKSITVSGGVGNGRFRMISDQQSNKKTINVFGSAAVLVHDQVSVITDYTGSDVNIGMSIVPFKAFPISITPALADVTGTASKSPRFILGMGVGLHF